MRQKRQLHLNININRKVQNCSVYTNNISMKTTSFQILIEKSYVNQGTFNIDTKKIKCTVMAHQYAVNVNGPIFILKAF